MMTAVPLVGWRSVWPKSPPAARARQPSPSGQRREQQTNRKDRGWGMAATAGQSAVLDAAMPIAQQDASTYADSSRFNADASNTFSRDNNAFVRDSFMADFNLQANEWAKQQDQQRTYAQMDYAQRQTLERDAIQNGYTSARDAIQNGFTIDADTRKFNWQANENAMDRTAAAQRTAMGIQPDTSLQRTGMQIDADNARYAADAKKTATNNLATLKTEWAGKIINIQTADLTPEQKGAALATLTSAYNPIVQSYAITAGLDPTNDPALGLRYTGPGATTAPATNVVQAITQGADGN